ncbi:Oxaloacetate decarboxylase [compost metagenome]
MRIVVSGHAAYYAALKATYDCLREQRRIDTGVLETKELVARYSEAEQYAAWAENYLKVRS